jgi:hypothetical protein
VSLTAQQLDVAAFHTTDIRLYIVPHFVFDVVLNICREVFVLVEKEPKVELGDAKKYAILSKAGITNVPQSVITGDIGVSPIAATAMTGFSLILDSEGQHSTSTQVTGTHKAEAASYGGAVAEYLTKAVLNMEAAYTDAAGRLNPDAARINLGGGILGGDFGGTNSQLTPGVYTFGVNVVITEDIYFMGSGTGKGQGDTDVFIIQISGYQVLSSGKKVHLMNGALAKNIFWQVAGYVAVGTGASMEGIILSKTDVTFKTGSSLNGRVFAQTACVLQMATITQPDSAPATRRLSLRQGRKAEGMLADSA